MIRNAWIAMSVSLALSAGCGAAPEVETTQVGSALTVAEKTEVAAVTADAQKLVPASAEHLYFDTPSVAYTSDTAPYGHRFFTANAGHAIKAVAFEDDGTGQNAFPQIVDFTLQHAVNKSGHWQWEVVAYSQRRKDSGAALSYTPPASAGQGLYLLSAEAQQHPGSITVSLSCADGGCATASQPGQSCGGRARTLSSCDDGLFCNWDSDAAMCGATDSLGSCVVRPTLCPTVYSPVCGCDGKTYSNKCTAGAAGQSVSRQSRCEVDVVGAWQQKLPSGAVIDYTFAADGTFTSVEQPSCVFSSPACMIKLAPGRGTYSIADWTVNLAYTTPDSHAPNTTSFMFSTSTSADHMRGADYDNTLDLTRTP